MTVNIDSSTPVGTYEITYKVVSDDGVYEKDHKFEIKVWDCGQLFVANPSAWILNLATGRKSDNFEYDKYSAPEIYKVADWTHDCNSVCGCITYTSTYHIPAAVTNPTNYISTIDSSNRITVDMSAYPTSSFETLFEVTVTGTNQKPTSRDMKFTIKVYDCLYQVSPKPQNSVDMIVYKG